MDCYALNSKARKLFHEKLIDYFGLPKDFKVEGILFESTRNKYFLIDQKYSEFVDLKYNIKVLGVYIAEINKFGEIRLSIEGSQIIGPKATKHIIDLKNEEFELFVRGEDLEIKDLKNDFYIISYDDGMKHYIGCAKAKNGQLFNYTPKNRRVRD